MNKEICQCKLLEKCKVTENNVCDYARCHEMYKQYVHRQNRCIDDSHMKIYKACKLNKDIIERFQEC